MYNIDDSTSGMHNAHRISLFSSLLFLLLFSSYFSSYFLLLITYYFFTSRLVVVVALCMYVPQLLVGVGVVGVYYLGSLVGEATFLFSMYFFYANNN